MLEWNGLIERIISYYHDYHINSFFLQDGQSLPIMLETDYDSASTLRDVMEGSIVYSNEEGGYWKWVLQFDKYYPNPFLVKLTRKVYELCPDALLSSNGVCSYLALSIAYWDRSEFILQCGILPVCKDLLSVLSKYNQITIAKNGTVEALSKESSLADSIDDLTHFSHITSTIVNGNSYFIHYLCNESSPYPAITLKRATWPAVCLLHTLPSMSLCYFKEDEGRCIKVTQGDEYTIEKTHYQSSSEEEEVVEMMNLQSGDHQKSLSFQPS